MIILIFVTEWKNRKRYMVLKLFTPYKGLKNKYMPQIQQVRIISILSILPEMELSKIVRNL